MGNRASGGTGCVVDVKGLLTSSWNGTGGTSHHGLVLLDKSLVTGVVVKRREENCNDTTAENRHVHQALLPDAETMSFGAIHYRIGLKKQVQTSIYKLRHKECQY